MRPLLGLAINVAVLNQEAQEKKEAGETNSTDTSEEGADKKEDAWAKIGDTISSFFGGRQPTTALMP